MKPAPHPRLLALYALLVGCTGSVEAGPALPGPGGSTTPDADVTGPPALALCNNEATVGSSVLRRLSNLELQLTLQDLFQLPSPPDLAGVPIDNDKEGFKTFAELQPMSAQHLRAYSDKARELADALLTDNKRRAAVVGCETSASSCLRDFVTRFGRLAYRRSLAADEVETIAGRALTNAIDATDQIRYAIQALLSSADFLYRVEVGDKPEGLSTLQPSELAARLSFALWGRAPSLQLLEDAEAGKLSTPSGLHGVTTSMLADQRAHYLYAGFFRQWLGYETLRAPQTKPADWSDTLLVEMQRETDAVVAKHAFGDGAVLNALTTNQTMVTASLAAFYGFTAPGADGLVNIPASHARANSGVLGHASLLSLKSDGDMIALRGNWLRRTFFCSTLEIPPEIAADLGDLLVGLTRVEIVEKRNSEAACKGCHAQIDPIGVGLSAFDATGRFDPKVDIRQYGIEPALPGVPSPRFDSLAALAEKLRSSPAVSACLAEKVFLYMNGRASATDDRCSVAGAEETFASSGQGFRSLVAGLVEQPAFRLRRAPALDSKAEE